MTLVYEALLDGAALGVQGVGIDTGTLALLDAYAHDLPGPIVAEVERGGLVRLIGHHESTEELALAIQAWWIEDDSSLVMANAWTDD